MSVYTSTLKSTRRSHRVVVVTVIAAVAAAAVWAIATYAVGSGGRSAEQAVGTRASVPAASDRQDRQYVRGIVSLDPAQIAAAFGNGR